MASRRVDALLLTDANEMLCGILTDKVCHCDMVKVFITLEENGDFMISFLVFQDIATRVISQEVNVEETPVSKVMTRNPMFVLSETLAVEALQKMVIG